RGRGRAAVLAATGVDADVVHDGKEPAPDVASPPQMGAAPGPLETVLHQVVRPVAIAHEGEGVTPQMRDLRRHQRVEVVDGGLPSVAMPGGDKTMNKRVTDRIPKRAAYANARWSRRACKTTPCIEK